MLFQLKKPRVNSNATPRGCRERTLCTSDEHYHTHTPTTPSTSTHARVNDNDKHGDDEAHARRPHVSNGSAGDDGAEQLLRARAWRRRCSREMVRSSSAYKRMLASMTHDGYVIFKETTIYGQRSHELKGAAAGLTDVVQAELLAKSTSFPQATMRPPPAPLSLRIAAPDIWATWPGCPPRVSGVPLKY